MADLMNEFKSESEDLVNQMIGILESCESGASGPVAMEDFGQLADRMMGGARQLVSNLGGDHSSLTSVAKFTQLCKLLGYKASQLGPTSALLPVSVGVLLDASEELRTMIVNLKEQDGGGSAVVSTALLERLKWLNEQFGANIDGGVPMSSGRIIDPNQLNALFDQLKKGN